jgi:hypothetical protein
MEAGIMEVVCLRTKAGVDPAAFAAALITSTRFLEQQCGFIRREVGTTADDEWIDIVHWADREAALQAAALFNTAPETGDFTALIDPSSVLVRHVRPVQTTERI